MQVDWAKRTVESLDRQITAAQAEHQAVLSAFDAQLQQAAAWRDEELAELRNLSFLTAEQRKALDDLLKSIMPAPDMGASGWDPVRDQLQPDLGRGTPSSTSYSISLMMRRLRNSYPSNTWRR